MRQLTQAEAASKGQLSRGDLAGRLAATLNKSLKDRTNGPASDFAAGFFVFEA
jgi:hypothetical protein